MIDLELQTPAATIDFGEMAEMLGFLVRIVQVRNFDDFYEKFGDTGLKTGEFSVLHTIGLNPGIRQGALAAAMHVKPASMTKLVRQMEDKGLVRREIPDEDRRSVLLFITRQGEKFVADNRDAFFGTEREQTLLLGMTEQERRTLARLLRRYAGID